MVTVEVSAEKNGVVGVLAGKLNDIIEWGIAEPARYLINWGRMYALWPVHVETACCSVEFGAVHGPRFDIERFGILEAFGSLRQCDLLIVFGTVTRKMAPRLKMVYEQMPEPKYVIAMGACAISYILTLIMFFQVLKKLCLLMFIFLVVRLDLKQ